MGKIYIFTYVENSYCKIEAIKIPPAKVINETQKKIVKEIGYDIDRWCGCIRHVPPSPTANQA